MNSVDWFAESLREGDDFEFARRLLERSRREEEETPRARSKRRQVARNVASGHDNIMRDYLGPNATYTAEIFERRFLIPKVLFTIIVTEFTSRGLMLQRRDAANRPGASTEQMIMCALRILQSGSSLDSTDQYCRLGETTARRIVRQFCHNIDIVFGDHVRWPSVDDLQQLYSTNAKRGFPGLVGSLDCMHWAWKACPRALAGQYKGKEKRPTLVIEAVADASTRFWHVFIGTPGACNDIIVLDRSPLMSHFLNSADAMHQVSYRLNGKERRTGYLLADGIYPDYAVLAKPLSNANEEGNCNIAQSAVRKDVERAFGQLQGRFGILEQPARWRCIDDLVGLVRACVILHNMRLDFQTTRTCNPRQLVQSASLGVLNPMLEIMSNSARIMSATEHQNLRQDLIQHLQKRRRRQRLASL